MIRRPSLVALARALHLLFFLATSVYCLLTYNAFTYEQFIKPHVSAALTSFAVWHGSLHWLVLSITALTLAPYLERSRARWLGWGYLALSLPLAIWFFTRPLWLLDDRSGTSLAMAFVATFPPIWLAAFDHVALGPVQEPSPSSDGRIWISCLIAALFVWVAYAAAAPIRLRMTGGIDLPASAVLLGSAVSFVAHVTTFALVGLVLTAIGGVAAFTRTPGRTAYWLLFAVTAAGMTVTVVRVVLAPISIVGGTALAVSAAIGVSMAAAWSGMGRHRLAGRATLRSALDGWLAPLVTSRSFLVSGIALVAVPIAAHLLVARIATFDWEFMLQKLVALGVWLAAFAFVHAIVRERAARRGEWIAPAAALVLFAGGQVALPRIPAWASDARLNPELVLDGYAAVDPSYRIARDLLGARQSGDAAPFYSFLRTNSTLQDASIQPVAIDLVAPGARAADRPPNIFLFIIDSLRPDYSSPYNSAVPFTPAIRAFADDAFVFTRAFSRYGGTGLSVPSIWAGAMLIHKQYVKPFAPTNALAKLVAANGYRRFITEDHISDDLFTANPGNPGNLVGLDHNIPEMLHTFCRTMGELTTDLRRAPTGEAPLFAMTRPLELHIGNIATATVPAKESYPGFYGPYAARVKRIDECFGQFINTLKDLHLYDNSIVVLTADHGDSLGEGQRWGHGFTVFPEVMRIPLLVHLPPALESRVSTDLGRLSFSIDVTPTLYALVGSTPAVPPGREDLFGAPLFVDRESDLVSRRRGSYLVASSYGAVYGLLSQNGRRLYIADGIEGREYAFDLSPGSGDRRIGVTDAERSAARQTIRRQIGELADWYRFTPTP